MAAVPESDPIVPKSATHGSAPTLPESASPASGPIVPEVACFGGWTDKTCDFRRVFHGIRLHL